MIPGDIQIYYAQLDRPLKQSCFDAYKDRLPRSEQARIENYKREQDRLAALVGKALLMIAATDRGFALDWSSLQRDAYGRPYFTSGAGFADFNISHSGRYVVVAISMQGAVGIDIEARGSLTLADFENCFTPMEWRRIMESEDSTGQFFKSWCIKEAVIKAIGKGLSIPLADVHIEAGYARVAAEQYAYKQIVFREDYHLVVAAPQLSPLPIVPVDLTGRLDWAEEPASER